ncbi:uncharacterized protein K441DRAFT_682847 [Cenococcum geophilum 1.58]|uniref:Uncharacterized protein n=1 Tax=Cenococcum geophilum 1.58 TaxID=794803 RepID=A0ACC8ELI0_9PEZI|nr:hypothetical protein K441DRAFT_682847 [Cenococcum geophilum 1.58]
MIRLLPVALVAWLLTAVSCVDFINPPPFGKEGDFSRNPIYPEESTLNIQWTTGKEDKPVSITLYQLNGTQYMEPSEYIICEKTDLLDQRTTSFPWLVRTGKNLTFSNMFWMSIFEEGSLRSDANSHYFNISSDDTSPPPTTSTSAGTTSSTLSTSLTSTPSDAPISKPSTAPTSTSSPAPSGGLTTGAKIGIGVGIPVAMALGIGASFFIFKRRKHDKNSRMTPVPQGDYHRGGYHNGPGAPAGYYGEALEGPLKPPVEMAHSRPEAELDSTPRHHQTMHKAPAVGMPEEPLRYELHAPYPQ